jgi:hypothetical protein
MGEGKTKGHDVVLLRGRTPDGKGVRAVRSRPERIDLAEIRPLQEGRPIHDAELVRLHPREESPLLYDVEVQYGERDQGSVGHEGPARVTSPEYRENWDAVFGRHRRGPAN